MSTSARIYWSRRNAHTIADTRWSPSAGFRRAAGWQTIEPWGPKPDRTIVICVDGQLRGAAAFTRRMIQPPSCTFEFAADEFPEGSQRWLVGNGLSVHPDLRDGSDIDRFIGNARILSAAENGDAGVVCPVRYSGWRRDHEGGEDHYLRMVAYGTTRDANLTPYLQAGFWIAGRASNERVAWLARASE